MEKCSVVLPETFTYRPPQLWFRGGMATQRTANPCMGVRFPPEPPKIFGGAPCEQVLHLRSESCAN